MILLFLAWAPLEKKVLMSNNWFQFKKFLINQDKCAMKVGTDGVLLGAWCTVPESTGSVLDIGTGTGLIALMVAQRTLEVCIDAIEIDEASCEQAKVNVLASDWSERITVTHISFQEFAESSPRSYDLLVCNPPFFSNSKKAERKERNLARHDDHLNPSALMKYSHKLLTDSGILSIIIACERMEEMVHFASMNKLWLSRIARVRPVPGGPFKRALLEFTRSKETLSEEEITIEEYGRHGYSERYRELTGDFYM
jgi:tRNA1Val (adenine37-N6)-methyltransferase